MNYKYLNLLKKNVELEVEVEMEKSFPRSMSGRIIS
jgi:hypothetical protein